MLQDLGGTASKQKIKEEIVAAKKIKIKNDLVCKLSHFFTGFQNIELKPRCFFAYSISNSGGMSISSETYLPFFFR